MNSWLNDPFTFGPTYGAKVDDPLPRPPRRRIHGVMWIWPGFYQLSEEGFVLGDIPGDEFADLGYAMGCVKDDDGDLFTREAL